MLDSTMTAQPASNDVFEDGSSDWIETSRRKAPPTIALDNTEKTSNTYKVLLKISIPDTPGIKINQMVDIRAVLDKLFDVNPEIKLISLDKKFQISTMREFPRSQTHFEKFFPCETITFNKLIGNSRGHYSTQFFIESLHAFTAIKTPDLYKFLLENKIFLTQHELTTNQTARMAIITKKHTKVTNIITLAENLRQAIHSHLVENSGEDLPTGLTSNLATQLFIRTETIRHRILDPTDLNPQQQTTIEATAFCIYTNKEQAAILGNYLANTTILPEAIFGHWVPWTARLDRELFAAKLREHNAYQATIKFHVLEGVRREMMYSRYSDSNTDKEYTSCYQAIFAMQPDQEGLEDDESNLDSTRITNICEAPEPTQMTETIGRWFIPFLGNPDKSIVLLEQLIKFWTETVPIDKDVNPILNPMKARAQQASIAEKYIKSQRNKNTTSKASIDSQYNKGRLPQRSRPPVMVEIDNSNTNQQPSWSHIVQNKPKSQSTRPTQLPPRPQPTLEMLGHALRGNNITPSQGLKKGTRKATVSDDHSDHSESSVATTITSNRTDFELLLQQMRTEHQQTMAAYKKETDLKLEAISAQLQIRGELEEARESRYERIHNKLSESIIQLTTQMTQLYTRQGSAQPPQPHHPVGNQHQYEPHMNSISDEDMLTLANSDAMMTFELSGKKRPQEVRTPPRTSERTPRTKTRAHMPHESLEKDTSPHTNLFNSRPASSEDECGADSE